MAISDALIERNIEQAAGKQLQIFASVFEDPDGRYWITDNATGRVWYATPGRYFWEWSFEPADDGSCIAVK